MCKMRVVLVLIHIHSFHSTSTVAYGGGDEGADARVPVQLHSAGSTCYTPNNSLPGWGIIEKSIFP
jgi:hypothetical protein